MLTRTLIAVCGVALLAAGAAQAQDLPSAQRFVGAIYAHYPSSPKKPEYDPMSGALARSLFDATLLKLFAEDRRLSEGGVGVIDFDPFCDCQDDGGTRYAVGPGAAAGPGAASVKVVRRGPDKAKPETITLALTWTPAGWRIRDIGTPSTPSLVAMLRTGIVEEKKDVAAEKKAH